MVQTEADVQKTQNPSRGISALEDNLEQVTLAITECFEAARTIPRREDEFGHRRHSEYQNAVALLKASAKIGRTLAQIQGSKFDHNISVTRQLKPSPAPRRTRVPQNVQAGQQVALPPPPADFEGSNG
jgi:hypothetical protein